MCWPSTQPSIREGGAFQRPSFVIASLFLKAKQSLFYFVTKAGLPDKSRSRSQCGLDDSVDMHYSLELLIIAQSESPASSAILTMVQTRNARHWWVCHARCLAGRAGASCIASLSHFLYLFADQQL